MVGFYFFMKDFIPPGRSISLFGCVMPFFRSTIPFQSLKLIFSVRFTGLKNSVLRTEMAHQFGFQGKSENKFSLYEGNRILKPLNPGTFGIDFTYSKCSYSRVNSLFLPSLLLLIVRGFYFPLFQLIRKKSLLSFVYV
jgi:hypothetical protein